MHELMIAAYRWMSIARWARQPEAGRVGRYYPGESPRARALHGSIDPVATWALPRVLAQLQPSRIRGPRRRCETRCSNWTAIPATVTFLRRWPSARPIRRRGTPRGRAWMRTCGVTCSAVGRLHARASVGPPISALSPCLTTLPRVGTTRCRQAGLQQCASSPALSGHTLAPNLPCSRLTTLTGHVDDATLLAWLRLLALDASRAKVELAV